MFKKKSARSQLYQSLDNLGKSYRKGNHSKFLNKVVISFTEKCAFLVKTLSNKLKKCLKLPFFIIFSYKSSILQKRRTPVLLAYILKTTKNETIITVDHHNSDSIMGAPI